MDIIILSVVICGWVLFFVWQTLRLRFIPVASRGRWIVVRFCLMACAVTLTVVLVGMGRGYPMAYVVITGICTLVLFTTVSYVYLVVVFGGLYASVNLLLLLFLQQAGPSGASERDVYRKLAPAIVLGERIQLLLKTGDIAVSGTRIRLKNRQSLRLINELAIEAVAYVSGIKDYGRKTT